MQLECEFGMCILLMYRLIHCLSQKKINFSLFDFQKFDARDNWWRWEGYLPREPVHLHFTSISGTEPGHLQDQKHNVDQIFLRSSAANDVCVWHVWFLHDGFKSATTILSWTCSLSTTITRYPCPSVLLLSPPCPPRLTGSASILYSRWIYILGNRLWQLRRGTYVLLLILCHHRLHHAESACR